MLYEPQHLLLVAGRDTAMTKPTFELTMLSLRRPISCGETG